MSRVSDHSIVIFQDRYGGAYSGGPWIAVAGASQFVDDSNTRIQFCLVDCEGPSGGDAEAAAFWRNPPEWIAVGRTLEDAIEALRNRFEAISASNTRSLSRDLDAFRSTQT